MRIIFIITFFTFIFLNKKLFKKSFILSNYKRLLSNNSEEPIYYNDFTVTCVDDQDNNDYSFYPLLISKDDSYLIECENKTKTDEHIKIVSLSDNFCIGLNSNDNLEISKLDSCINHNISIDKSIIPELRKIFSVENKIEVWIIKNFLKKAPKRNIKVGYKKIFN